MTKLRYLLLGYLAVMLILLFLLSQGLRGQSDAGRDMIFYNEQRVLAGQAMAEGKDRARIEQDMGCEILLYSDDDYEMKLNEAYRSEALVMDIPQGRIIWHAEEKRYLKLTEGLQKKGIALWTILLIGGFGLLIFFYVRMLRPFRQLQMFTSQVAKGNLDFSLPVKKHDYFGAFTESFDLMREELQRARESEYQANKSKKELVAELSHDIKTPISTIRATCEVLQVKEQNPDTLRKVSVIDAKAKMVDELVTNLFQASLEDLEVLKVEPAEERSDVIREMFRELADYSDIRIHGGPPPCLVYMDRLRLRQVIDNCVSNSWKYAGTPVTIDFYEQDAAVGIKIRDEGAGVPAEELVLITEKFYRGSNARGREGSGLGLYLARQFMERMYGGLTCYNENGFVVELMLKKV